MPSAKPAAGPVLRYAGEGSVPEIPARDLTHADLRLLVGHGYVRRRYATLPDKLATFLVGTGVYTDAASASAADADSGKESE